MNKTGESSPAGRLHPMPIPKRPWESIGMDFLGPVLKSASGKDMILVIIDRLTKMTRFIPTNSSVTSKKTADLFLREVFQHHGLPSNIVSDRDPRFTAKFWKALQKALGVQLLMSTAEHPQTDGQAQAHRAHLPIGGDRDRLALGSLSVQRYTAGFATAYQAWNIRMTHNG